MASKKAQEKELRQLESEGFTTASDSPLSVAEGLASDITGAFKPGLTDAEHFFESLAGKHYGDPAPAAKKAGKKATSPVSMDQTLQEFANTLAEKYASEPLQAIGQEGATLANENKAVTNAIAPLLAGTSAANAGGSADPAVQAAMDAYAKAYATGEAVNSVAYQNMGLANEQYLAASPEAAYLQLLSQPGSEYYKQIPAPLLAQLPESLQYALSQTGLPNVPVPAGGWPAAVKKEFGGTGTGSSIAGALINPYGTTPGTSGNPTSPTILGGGNPATPGTG